MNPFWSMSTSSVRKRTDGEEKTLTGDVKTSPPRTAPKKQLPSIPKNALPITKPTSPAPAAQSTNGTHASYGPFYLEYSLLAEFTLVVKQKLPGVYVQPSYRSALMWFGVIFIRHGLYQDGVFKFTVYIPDNYPDGDCPRLVFDIPVFHPLVDPTSGELDVKRAFAKWSFSPWNPSIHDEAREKMLTPKKKPEEQHSKSVHVAGLSWVKPGSVQPFSKEEKTVAT
ncbi:AKT-interacting protein [Sorex araneus]|uniref:AKT-interacting protein n=1 Tax=Sorex araneus TaxID=42254 RepID=UPI00064A740E|nr:AKT-interacting protein [Sorex araneus]